MKGHAAYVENTIVKDDRTPIVLVVPGLTSDSNSPVSCISSLLSGEDPRWFFYNLVLGNERDVPS